MTETVFGDDELYDYIDLDCVECGLKFIVGPLTKQEKDRGKKYPTQCGRCQHGLAPLYEY